MNVVNVELYQKEGRREPALRLTAFVDEQAKWKVNPVTVGTRLGVQVDQIIDD